MSSEATSMSHRSVMSGLGRVHGRGSRLISTQRLFILAMWIVPAIALN